MRIKCYDSFIQNCNCIKLKCTAFVGEVKCDAKAGIQTTLSLAQLRELKEEGDKIHILRFIITPKSWNSSIDTARCIELFVSFCTLSSQFAPVHWVLDVDFDFILKFSKFCVSIASLHSIEKNLTLSSNYFFSYTKTRWFSAILLRVI